MEEWHSIVAYYRETNEPIQLCTGYTADACSATKALIELMKRSLIPHAVHPVDTTSDLRRVVEDNSADVPFLYFLIGCGSSIDVSTVVDVTKHRVHILDSARPFHLANLRMASDPSTAVTVWGLATIAADVDKFFRRHSSKRRRERSRADDSSVSSDSEESETDEVVEWREEGSVAQELESLYYAAVHNGRSAAMTAFDLASEHGGALKEVIIWFATVGVTDLYLRKLIDLGSYLTEMAAVQDAVNQVNVARRLGDHDANSAATGTSYTSFRLKLVSEYKLSLLRHWTLWDSLWHDPFISSKVGVCHSQEGMNKLRSALVRVGVSHRDAERTWSEITLNRRNEILEKLAHDLRTNFNVGTLTIPSVVKCTGYLTEVSAMDACRFFGPALCYPMQGDSPATIRRKQFWYAFDSIDLGELQKSDFSKLVQHAKKTYTAISMASSALLMERGPITSTRTIHYGVLRHKHDGPDLANHTVLSLLAEHVVEALAVERASSKRYAVARPLVLSAVRADSDSSRPADVTTVVTRVKPSGPHKPSKFAEALNATVAASMAQVGGISREGNESCWLKIDTIDKATAFVETLHLRLSSRALAPPA